MSYDDEGSYYRWMAFASIVPALVVEGLTHYRWHVERRDKQRKRDFEKRLSKALDEALAKDRAERGDAK